MCAGVFISRTITIRQTYSCKGNSLKNKDGLVRIPESWRQTFHCPFKVNHVHPLHSPSTTYQAGTRRVTKIVEMKLRAALHAAEWKMVSVTLGDRKLAEWTTNMGSWYPYVIWEKEVDLGKTRNAENRQPMDSENDIMDAERGKT